MHTVSEPRDKGWSESTGIVMAWRMQGRTSEPCDKGWGESTGIVMAWRMQGRTEKSIYS